MPDPIPTTSDPNHPGVQLMREFVVAITASGCPHVHVLDALISLYSQVALQFPCCHAGALEGLALVATQVQKARTLHHYSEQAALAAIERAAHGRTH